MRNARPPAERLRFFRKRQKSRRQVVKVEVDSGEVVASKDVSDKGLPKLQELPKVALSLQRRND
jgi:hypothetical protein